MALQLSEEQATGVTGEYWKIESIALTGEQQSTVRIRLYKDSAARVAGKEAMKELVYMWAGANNPLLIADMDLEDNNPFKLAYDKLKTLDEFDGALDV